MSPNLLGAISAGAMAAAMYLTVLTGSPGGMIMVYLAPLPLFLATFALGPQATLLASGLSLVLVFGIGGGLFLPLTFLVFSVLPVLVISQRVLLSRQLPNGQLEWYPPGLLLVALTGLGVGAVLLAAALPYLFGLEGGLRSLLHPFLAGSLTEMLRAAGKTGTANPAGEIADAIAQVFPGMVAVSWMIMVMINGMLAQGLLGRFNRLMRPALRMTELELPGWAPLALAVTVLGAVVLEGDAGFLLVNLVVIMSLPFFLSGLAVVHSFAARRASKLAFLVVFYLVMSFLAWLVIAVIGLGIIEQWAGLRGRLNAATPDRGEA